MRPSPLLRGIAHRLLPSSLIVWTALAAVGAAQDRGQLQIEGTHIARLVLHRAADGHTEKWSNLSGSVDLPVGTYSVEQLELRGGYACQTQGRQALGPIQVAKGRPVVLKAGGPLRQMIDVKRQGRTLVLSYRLLGIGDESYGPPGSPEARARFTVYRGDKAVASGAFEYG